MKKRLENRNMGKPGETWGTWGNLGIKTILKNN